MIHHVHRKTLDGESKKTEAFFKPIN